MKSFTIVLLLAVSVAAEPPRFLPRYRFQRQQLAEGNDAEVTTQKTDDAPYPAAGFRPAKEFNLPTRQETSPPATSYGTPDDSYGAPLETYGAPQFEYGPPENQNNDAEGKSKKEDAESLKADKKGNLAEEPKEDVEVVNSQGAYYVLLPNSQLQRVQFQTENDLRNMAYTARLQYRSEDRAPLFVYTAVPQYQSSAYVQLY